MAIIVFGFMGAAGLAMLVICARVMRRGVRTLDENRMEWRENMRQTEIQIEKDRKNMSSGEHLKILRAAMEDLLRLEGQPEGYSVREKDGILELSTPEGSWKVELLMRESGLRSSKRVLHGKSRWRLEGFGLEELHADPASLMRSLNERLHARSEAGKEEEQSHIIKRMSHLPQEPGQGHRI